MHTGVDEIVFHVWRVLCEDKCPRLGVYAPVSWLPDRNHGQANGPSPSAGL